MESYEAARAPERDRRATAITHRESAGAPERDFDAAAFELDGNALAPEAVPGSAPQVFYSNLLPEAEGTVAEPKEGCNAQKLPENRRTWRWVIVGLIIVMVIAVGVSVGVWRKNKISHHDSPPSPVASPTTSPNNSSGNNRPAPIFPQHVLNDTSLSAIILTNGDRHLFFQDVSGLVRRAIRTAASNSWFTGQELNFTTNAKLKSPFAAFVDQQDPHQIGLYYVTRSDRLSFASLGSAFNDNAEDLEIYVAAAGSRQLSTTPLLQSTQKYPTNSTTNLNLLLYENAPGTVAALLRQMDVDQYNYYTIHYRNITDLSSLSLPPGYRNMSESTSYTNDGIDSSPAYSTPFTTASETIDGSDLLATIVCFVPTKPSAVDSKNVTAGILLEIGLANSADFHVGNDNEGKVILECNGPRPGMLTGFAMAGFIEPQISDQNSIRQSDLAIFGSFSSCYLWINDTRPLIYSNNNSMADGANCVAPTNAFPFNRLASVTLLDGTVTYLYHQINGTTLAEEQFVNSLSKWLPTQYITIVND